MRIYPPFLSKARNSGRVEPQRGEGLGEFSIANRLSCVGVLLRKTVKLFLTHLLEALPAIYRNQRAWFNPCDG
jgi:hypothetical protein